MDNDRIYNPFDYDPNETQLRFRLNGPEIGERELVVGRQGLRVGRSSENTLSLQHREMSRQHLRVIWRDDAYYVEDLNSSNGTYLNDSRLPEREPNLLQVGDTIRFGPFLLTLVEIFTLNRQQLAGEPGIIDKDEMVNGMVAVDYPPGIPKDASSWLKYLPSIYSDDDFVGRYLLIFESIMMPIIWTVDNFDQYLFPDMAPIEWIQWITSWFDILVIPELPKERQQAILKQVGWLFLRRGTRAGLERLLELYFGVMPEIIEPDDEPCHFIVRLSLSSSEVHISRDMIEKLIQTQKPAFASFALELV